MFFELLPESHQRFVDRNDSIGIMTAWMLLRPIISVIDSPGRIARRNEKIEPPPGRMLRAAGLNIFEPRRTMGVSCLTTRVRRTSAGWAKAAILCTGIASAAGLVIAVAVGFWNLPTARQANTSQEQKYVAI